MKKKIIIFNNYLKKNKKNQIFDFTSSLNLREYTYIIYIISIMNMNMNMMPVINKKYKT